jgi:5-methylcytosine-specific restriction endonuclease McrA
MKMNNLDDLRTCTKCHRQFPNSFFYKKGRDRRSSRCPSCCKKYKNDNRIRANELCRVRYYKNIERNRSRAKQYSRKFYEQNKNKLKMIRREYYLTHKKMCNESSRQYYQKNKQKILARARSWKNANISNVLNYSKNYSKIHYQEKRVHNAKRRALIAGSSGNINLAEWENLKRFYDYKCLSCGKQEPEILLTYDHVIPLSKGGSHTISNIQPLCGSCNSRKNNGCTDYRILN